MDNHFIPTLLKKTLKPFRHLEEYFGSLWGKNAVINYVEGEGLISDIDVSENTQEFHVKAHIPKSNESDLHININNGKLTLQCERKEEKEEDLPQCHISEKAHVYFNHSIQFPHQIDERNVRATLENDTIDIILPKKKAER